MTLSEANKEESETRKHSNMISGDNLDWQETQQRTFTGWVNHALKKKNRRVRKDDIVIDDLVSGLKDGRVLISLVEILTGRAIPKPNNTPKLAFHFTENTDKALDVIEKQEGIKLVGIGPKDILDGRLTSILGLIWTLILEYQIKGRGSNKVRAKGVSPEQDLLNWVAEIVPEGSASNFQQDFASGNLLANMVVNLQKKHNIPPTEYILDIQDPEQKVSESINVANDTLKVPPIVQAKDIVGGSLDKLSMMTYLSFFRDFDPNETDEDIVMPTETTPTKNMTRLSITPSPRSSITKQPSPTNVSPVDLAPTEDMCSLSPVRNLAHDFTDEVRKLKEKLKTFETSHQRHNREIKERDEQIRVAMDNFKKIEQQLHEKQIEHDKLMEQKLSAEQDKHVKELETKKKQIHELEQITSQQKDQIERLNENIPQLVQKLSVAETHAKDFEEKYAQSIRDLEQATKDVTNCKSSAEQTREELKQVREAAKELESKNAQTMAELDELKNRLLDESAMQQKLLASEKLAKELGDKNVQVQSELELLKKQLQEESERLNKCNVGTDDLQIKLKESEQQRESIDKLAKELQSKNVLALKEIEDLRNKLADGSSLEKQLQEAQQLAEKYKQSAQMHREQVDDLQHKLKQEQDALSQSKTNAETVQKELNDKLREQEAKNQTIIDQLNNSRQQLEKSITEYESKNATLQAELDKSKDLHNELKQAQQKLVEAENNLSQVRNEHSQANVQIKELNEKVGTLNDKLVKAESHAKQLEEQNTASQLELDAIRKRIQEKEQAKESSIQELEKQIATLKQDASKLGVQLDEKTKAEAIANERNAELSKQVEANQNKANKITEDLLKALKDVQDAKTLLGQNETKYKQSISELEKQRDQFEQKCTNQEKAKSEADNRIVQLEKDLQMAVKDGQDTKKQLGDNEIKYKQSLDELEKLRDQLSHTITVHEQAKLDADNRITQLEQELKNAQQEAESTRNGEIKELREKVSTIPQLVDKLAVAETHAKDFEEKYAKNKLELETLQRELLECKKQVEQLSKNSGEIVEQLQQQVSSLQNQAAKHAEEMESQKRKNIDAESRCSELGVQLDEKTKAEAIANERNAELSKQVQDNEKKANKVAEDLLKALQDAKTLVSENETKYKQSLDELEKQRNQFEQKSTNQEKTKSEADSRIVQLEKDLQMAVKDSQDAKKQLGDNEIKYKQSLDEFEKQRDELEQKCKDQEKAKSEAKDKIVQLEKELVLQDTTSKAQLEKNTEQYKIQLDKQLVKQHELESEASTLQSERKELLDTVNRLQQQVTEKANQVQQLVQSNEQKDSTINDLTNKLREQSTNDNKAKQIEKLNKDIRELNDTLEKTKNDYERKLAEQQGNSQELINARKTIADNNDAIVALSTEVDSLKKQLAKQQEEYKKNESKLLNKLADMDKNQQVESLKKQNHQLTEQNKRLSQDTLKAEEALRESEKNTKEKLSHAATHVAQIEKQMKENDNKIKQFDQEKEKLQKKIAEADKKLDDKDKELLQVKDTLQSSQKEKQREIEAIENDKKKIKKQVEDLESVVKKLEEQARKKANKKDDPINPMPVYVMTTIALIGFIIGVVKHVNGE